MVGGRVRGREGEEGRERGIGKINEMGWMKFKFRDLGMD